MSNIPFIVYGIKLKDNNTLRYIGSTKRELKFRIQNHKRNSLLNNEPIYKWIRSVGWENIEFEVLLIANSHKQMRLKEMQLIELNSNLLNLKKHKAIKLKSHLKYKNSVHSRWHQTVHN